MTIIELEKENEELKRQINILKVRASVSQLLTDAGVLDPGAREDALLQAEQSLEIAIDGVAVTKAGLKVPENITAGVWLDEMRKSGRVWFKDAGKDSAKNPFTKEHFNLTEQGRLYRENPIAARQMAKVAGIDLE
jgi:hypothetical protein